MNHSLQSPTTNQSTVSDLEKLNEIEKYVEGAFAKFTSPYLNENDLGFLIAAARHSLESDSRKYKCINQLVLHMIGKEGFPIEGEEFIVEVGSFWENPEHNGPSTDNSQNPLIRLIDEKGRWLNISQNQLQLHFVKI